MTGSCNGPAHGHFDLYFTVSQVISLPECFLHNFGLLDTNASKTGKERGTRRSRSVQRPDDPDTRWL